MVDVSVPENVRTCTGCGEKKAYSEFYKRNVSGIRSKCKKCSLLDTNGRRTANVEKYREIERLSVKRHFEEHALKRIGRSRAWKLKYVYKISHADFIAMLEKQKHRCAICKNPIRDAQRGRSPRDAVCIDHDHVTGKIRGLLCNPCNRGLGSFCDRIDLLATATDYLRSHRQCSLRL